MVSTGWETLQELEVATVVMLMWVQSQQGGMELFNAGARFFSAWTENLRETTAD